MMSRVHWFRTYYELTIIIWYFNVVCKSVFFYFRHNLYDFIQLWRMKSRARRELVRYVWPLMNFSFHFILVTDSNTTHLQDVLQQIFSWMTANMLLLLTLLRPNFSSNGSFLKYTTQQSLSLILHATFVLVLTNILTSLIRSHHFLSPAVLISVNSIAFHPSLHWFYCPL